MTYEDNQEWIHNSVSDWLRSGASVVARNPEDGSIAGTLLATVLTRNRNTSFDEALNSPRLKVSPEQEADKNFALKVGRSPVSKDLVHEKNISSKYV